VKSFTAPQIFISDFLPPAFLILCAHDFSVLTRSECAYFLLSTEIAPCFLRYLVLQRELDINSCFVTRGDCAVVRIEARACVRACWNYEFHSGLCSVSPCLMHYVCRPDSEATSRPRSLTGSPRVTENTTKSCQVGLIIAGVFAKAPRLE